jgi:phosphoenolpyruvate-protein phosphotransferase
MASLIPLAIRIPQEDITMSVQTQTLQGSGGAQGITQGVAYLYKPLSHSNQGLFILNGDAAKQQFKQAQDQVVARLDQLAHDLTKQGKNDEAAIFEAQAALVLDKALLERVAKRIDSGRQLADAIREASEEMAQTLAALDDPYFQERAADMRAIGDMLLASLGERIDWNELPANSIILAQDLSPAETAELPMGRIAGFATAAGGPTSHTIILARALGIPAVVGLGSELLELPNGIPLILNGSKKSLIVAPDAVSQAKASQQIAAYQAGLSNQARLRHQAGASADGHPIGLWANIGRPEEAEQAFELGAEGIGLFRSEFLFLERAAPPSEDEQAQAYRSALNSMHGKPVVIRTLDVGGDKPLPYLPMPAEANPFLGTRGLRLCMQHSDLFQTQLRALLRAAPAGDLWVMLPMVASLEDLRWARAELDKAAQSLHSQQIIHNSKVKLGVMIETPAAVAIADLLAQEADFFSIGSNDLAQYTLAVDRGDPELARRYPADSLPVLRLMAQTAAVAQRAGIPIGICGELGGELDVAPILAGLGIEKLSMTPRLIPSIKEHLLSLSLAEMQQQALQACRWKTFPF